jgi:hypothetical protein
MEWFFLNDSDYSALRRRRLVTGVYSLRVDPLDPPKTANRLCFVTPLGRSVAAIAMEAAEPTRREAGSARKGDSAGPKDIAQRRSNV